MHTWPVNKPKEAEAFLSGMVDPEKIIGEGGVELCRYRAAIPWTEYERIKALAAKA